MNLKKLVAFVPSTDASRARSFYEGTLGLSLVSEDVFALVFITNESVLRVTNVRNFTPQPFTVLGWDVANIDEAVENLKKRGVQFEQYGMTGQDERGVWKSPSGAQVAWFKDPDGNVLSLTQSAT